MDPVTWIVEEHELAGAWGRNLLSVLELKQSLGRPARLESLEIYWHDQVVPHLEFEEERLFPVLREVCPSSELSTVLDTLSEEHVRLQRSFNEAIRAAREPPGGETSFAESARDAISSLLDHAKREDTELVPLVEGHLRAIRQRFRERENAAHASREA